MARRKKQDEAERLTAYFGVQVTPAQKAEIENRAKATGMSSSEFARIVLLSDLKAPAPSARDPKAIGALIVEISRVGTNLNQLARRANEAAKIGGEKELAALMAMETELRSLNAQIAETMARVIEL